MTSPQPDAAEKKVRRRFLYGRSLGPLAGPWMACIAIAGAVLIFETRMPVFHEVVQIVYFILAVVLVIATGRWFRIRRGTRGDDRRNVDRRKFERRSDNTDQ